MNTEWLQLLRETLQKIHNEETIIQAINSMMEHKEEDSMTLLRLSTTESDLKKQSTIPIDILLERTK